MKIKCTLTGGEWWVDYIVATNPRTHECRQFYSGYEIVQPDPETAKQGPIESSSATTVEQLKYTLSVVIDRVDLQADQICDLRKYNNKLTGRLDAIEEEYAKAKSWINTLISDNKRIEDRLNAIERQTQGEP